jgi:hypothetical protein
MNRMSSQETLQCRDYLLDLTKFDAGAFGCIRKPLIP